MDKGKDKEAVVGKQDMVDISDIGYYNNYFC